MSYFVYVLECSNGAYYTGYTTDIERRYQEHVAGTDKCKYTRSFPPRRIAACWKVTADLSSTLKIECLIKRLSKKAKTNLTQQPEQLSAMLENIELAHLVCLKVHKGDSHEIIKK